MHSIHCSSFRQFLILLLTITTGINIVGCQSRPEVLLQKTDIPIKLTNSRLQARDLPYIIDQAATVIYPTLPQATFTGFVIFGNCNAFPEIEGRITLVFMETKRGLWGPLYYEALTSVNTVRQKMNLRIVSDPYLNYNPQRYDESKMDIVLQSVARYIQEHNISNCTVELAQLEDSWNAQCTRGEGQAWEEVCHFKIDAITGVIHEVQK